MRSPYQDVSGLEQCVANKPRIYGFNDFGGSVSKEFPCKAGDRDSIPGLGRLPGKETATRSSVLAWRIPWTEESGRLQTKELVWVRVTKNRTQLSN